MKKLLILTLVLALTACTQPDQSKRLLESQGMTNVEITGYNFFGCSEDDSFHTGFKAISVNGTEIKGTVCSGMFFKGATIRYD